MIEVKETEQFLDDDFFVAKLKITIEFNFEECQDSIALCGIDETYRKIGEEFMKNVW